MEWWLLYKVSFYAISGRFSFELRQVAMIWFERTVENAFLEIYDLFLIICIMITILQSDQGNRKKDGKLIIA